VDLTLRADASLLPNATLVASAVVTAYSGQHADGRQLGCELLLQDSGSGSLHDLKDPGLNPLLSRPYEFTGGTGSDFFTTLLLGLPNDPKMVFVMSVFDGSRGRGLRLARGCAVSLAPFPAAGASQTLELRP